MKEETFTYTDSENYHLFVYKWSPEISPKSVIQLSHGMTENTERYREFAEALTNEGFIVYGHDHRGHGKSVEEKQMFGYCGEDGFMKCMHNVHDINLYIREHHPELPIFLFGHSFGSFLVQRYITLFNEPLHGVILAGTSGKQNPITTSIGRMIAKHQIKTKGIETKGTLLDHLIFGPYNKKVRHRKTKFDWLTRDEKRLNTYIQTPHTGFVCSNGFYYDLLNGLSSLHDKRMNNISKELPIFLISGDHDPVGNYGKGIRYLENRYKKVGIKDVSSRLIPDARHEVLHELEREQHIKDMITWFHEHL